MTPTNALPRTVAVIAHTGKTLGGGLDELRRLLSAEQIKTLYWYEAKRCS